MKSVVCVAFYRLALAAACALLLAGAAGAQTETWAPEAGGLEGSWTVKVTQTQLRNG